MGYLERNVVEQMGFSSVGENVQISTRASFHNCKNIEIGSNVRIDDFCVISAGAGGVFIGNFVHVAVYCSLIGASKITLSDFSGLSSRVSIFSSSDDFSGATMTNPMVDRKYTGVKNEEVFLGKHTIVGCGAIILPGVVLEQGVAIGALSLVTKSCKEFGVYMGVPARFIRSRQRTLLDLEGEFLAGLTGKN